MQDTARRVRELSTLTAIAETLNRSLDVHQALDETLELLVNLMELETAWIFLLGPTGRRFQAVADHALPPALARQEKRPLRVGGCSCQSLFFAGELSEAINVVQCSRLQEASGDKCGLVYHASVPLRAQERVLGILNVAVGGEYLFSDEDLQLLSAVGFQMGTAIQRAQLYQEREELAASQERHRLARELHDAVTQTLFSMTLTAEAARSLVRTNPQQAEAALEKVQDMTRSALAEMRSLIFQLRPVGLEEQGLVGLLRKYTDTLPRPGELQVNFNPGPFADAGAERLPPAVEETLLRVAQEALGNVVKHAGAGYVGLRLLCYRGSVGLVVEDDGRGFDQMSPPSGRQGLGLTTMRERVEQFGGKLRVDSRPGKGTRVHATVPLRPPDTMGPGAAGPQGTRP